MSTGKDEVTKLRIVLGDYPHSRPLKSGEIRSPRLDLDFVEMKPTNTAFKPMVRELAYDVSEMAIVTFLQAKAYGKPLLLLPTVMLGRFQQQHIVCNAALGPLAPKDLVGRRVGVRAYSQTTGVWLRGILRNDYGVDTDRIRWVTFEDPHIAEYQDPPGVERAPAGKKLDAMVIEGELDAVIAEMPDHPKLRRLFADPAAEARRWHERHGTVQVNHFVTVKESLVRAKPWLVAELYRLLSRAKESAGKPGADGFDFTPFGIEATRRALELIIDYSAQQGLIPRRFSVDELFDDTVRALGT